VRHTVHADVYTQRGAYGFNCQRPGCSFKGWGYTREQIYERVAEHARNECPWTEETER
jgi:hypothetical protein